MRFMKAFNLDNFILALIWWIITFTLAPYVGTHLNGALIGLAWILRIKMDCKLWELPFYLPYYLFYYTKNNAPRCVKEYKYKINKISDDLDEFFNLLEEKIRRFKAIVFLK